MAGPIVEEAFEEMDEAITRNWTKRRSKPVMLINFCYDERFGKQTVTVISNWIQNQLISDFVNSGHYSVVDNNDLERLRNEKKLANQKKQYDKKFTAQSNNYKIKFTNQASEYEEKIKVAGIEGLEQGKKDKLSEVNEEIARKAERDVQKGNWNNPLFEIK